MTTDSTKYFCKRGALSAAPSVVLFEKYLLAASSLVLIFSKKVGFSLGKVKKVATKRILSDPAKFFSCRIKRHLFGVPSVVLFVKPLFSSIIFGADIL